MKYIFFLFLVFDAYSQVTLDSLQKQINELQKEKSVISKVNLSFFYDVQFQSTTDDAEETFLLADSSIYSGYQGDGHSLYIDIPVVQKSDDDLDNSVGSEFVIGEGRAQFYTTHELGRKMTLTVGQFDSLVGFEANDTLELDFAQTTSFLDAAFINTQLGIMGSLGLGNFRLDLTVGNKGGRSNTQGDGVEYGSSLVYQDSTIEAYASFLTFTDKGADSTDESENLTDIYFGYIFNQFRLDLEYALLDQNAQSELAIGTLARFSYYASEKLTYLIRYEDTENLNDILSAHSYAFGAKYLYLENYILKLNYMNERFKEGSNDQYAITHKYVASLITKF